MKDELDRIVEFLKTARRVVDGTNYDLLAYLIEMAQQEADELLTKRKVVLLKKPPAH